MHNIVHPSSIAPLKCELMRSTSILPTQHLSSFMKRFLGVAAATIIPVAANEFATAAVGNANNWTHHAVVAGTAALGSGLAAKGLGASNEQAFAAAAVGGVLGGAYSYNDENLAPENIAEKGYFNGPDSLFGSGGDDSLQPYARRLRTTTGLDVPQGGPRFAPRVAGDNTPQPFSNMNAFAPAEQTLNYNAPQSLAIAGSTPASLATTTGSGLKLQRPTLTGATTSGQSTADAPQGDQNFFQRVGGKLLKKAGSDASINAASSLLTNALIPMAVGDQPDLSRAEQAQTQQLAEARVNQRRLETKKEAVADEIGHEARAIDVDGAGRRAMAAQQNRFTRSQDTNKREMRRAGLGTTAMSRVKRRDRLDNARLAGGAYIQGQQTARTQRRAGLSSSGSMLPTGSGYGNSISADLTGSGVRYDRLKAAGQAFSDAATPLTQTMLGSSTPGLTMSAEAKRRKEEEERRKKANQ